MANLMLNRLYIVIFLLIIFGATAYTSDQNNNLILGISSNLLFHIAGIEYGTKRLTYNGVEYSIKNPSNAGGAPYLIVAVYPTLSLAKEKFHDAFLSHSIGPLKGEDFQLGDEVFVWSSGKLSSGTILFRRDNCLILFTWVGELNDALKFGRKLDGMLIDDSEIAEKGQFNPMPNLSGLYDITSDGRENKKKLSPIIKGLGKNKIMLKALSPDIYISSTLKDGFFEISIPSKKGAYKLIIFAANQRNVVVEKKINLVVK